MKRKTILFAFPIFACVPNLLFAQDGNFWNRMCGSSQMQDKTVCTAYVSGIVGGASGQAALSNTSMFACIPQGAINQQYVDIYTQYLEKHPEYRHMDGTVIAFRAISDAFPCKK